MHQYFRQILVVFLCGPFIRVAASVGVFGVDTLRLAACAIDQSGSTAIFGLLYAAAGNSASTQKVKLQKYSGVKLETLLIDSSWVKFVVLRDPVERFASAFLHSCILLRGECPEKEPENMNSVHSVLTTLERMVSFGELVGPGFRPFASSCNLRDSLSKYIIIEYENIEGELAGIIKSIPNANQLKRAEVLKAMQSFFHGGSMDNSKEIIGPPESLDSAALAASWRSAANLGEGSHPDADILPRLRRFYSEDFVLYYKFLLRSNITKATHFSAAGRSLPVDLQVTTGGGFKLSLNFYDERLTALLIFAAVVTWIVLYRVWCLRFFYNLYRLS